MFDILLHLFQNFNDAYKGEFTIYAPLEQCIEMFMKIEYEEHSTIKKEIVKQESDVCIQIL